MKQEIPLQIAHIDKLPGNLNGTGIHHSVYENGIARNGYVEKSDDIVQEKRSPLGPVAIRSDIKSSEGSFKYFPEYKTRYTEPVTNALAGIFGRYNRAFASLVELNTEWDSDYRYCMTGPAGSPINFGVQIDMVGLTQAFLDHTYNLTPAELHTALKKKIFEIENSLAGYGILEGMFSENGNSNFKTKFRASLDALREKHSKPIALLAVTAGKYDSMRGYEFGKTPGESLSSKEVKELSGFDAFFGPAEFAEHVRKNGGKSEYLLYARTSDPAEKLKNPRLVIEQPLLSNDEMRKIIKEYALTFNIDNPGWEPGDPRRINDTKAYLTAMGMAYPILNLEDIYSPQFAEYLIGGGKKQELISSGKIYREEFAQFLVQQGIDPNEVRSGDTPLRFKPEQGFFGCHGHEHGSIKDGKVRKGVKRQMRMRGGRYLIQPEMNPPTIINKTDNIAYRYIDRNFVFTIDGTKYDYLGGFRTMVMVGSTEEKAHRIHGSEDTVWAEVSGK